MMEIKDFIDKMNLFQKYLLEFLENEEDVEEKYSNLIKLFNDQKTYENQEEFKSFLKILLSIANNHHRTANFYSKIEQILNFLKNDIQKNFSPANLFELFQDNKRLLLFLIEEKMLIINKSISSKLLSYQNKSAKYTRYFYPEIKQYIKKNSVDLPENFEINRKIGENEDEICKIIRKDSIDNFTVFLKKGNLQMTSNIHHSIYETNIFLIQRKEVSLIEYASFFGSIQIFKFLFLNGVPLNSDLWLFAIHGNNMEIIKILEENNVNKVSFDLCFKESIKCFHNELAIYIHEKYLSKSDAMNDLENIQYYNFAFFKDNYDFKQAFSKFVEYDFVELIKIYCESNSFNINDIMNGESLFMKIVENNQLEMTRIFLTRSEIDINKRFSFVIDENKWLKKSALHIAIENENKEMVKLLLSHNDIDVDLKLIESNDQKDIEKEKEEKIKIEKATLIKMKDISKYWNESVEKSIIRKEITPLCLAIMKNKSSIVKALLEHSDTDINNYSDFYDLYSFKSIHDGDEESLITKSKFSKTALDIAIKNKSTKIIQILLMNPNIEINKESQKLIYIQYYYKKEIDTDFNVLNKIGTSTRTPLFYAIMKEDITTIELLIKKPEIDVNYLSHVFDIDNLIDKISDNFGYKKNIKKNSELEKLIINYDQEPLNLSFEKGNGEIVDLLLKCPQIDSDFKAFLPSVLQRGSIKTIQFLLEKEMIDINDNIIDGNTILCYAVLEGKTKIVEYLLTNPKIDVNKKNFEDYNPLFLAIEDERVEIVKLLLQHPKIDLNCHKDSKSPLHMAVKTKNEEIVFLLLKSFDVNVNKKTNKGKSPLHMAVKTENAEIVYLLLKDPDIDVNIQTNSDDTPLHFAVKKENENIVDLLLKNPEINVNIKDSSEKVPLYYAFKYKNDNIIDSLLKMPDIDVNIYLEDGSTPLNRSIEDENIGRVKLLLNNDSIDVNMIGYDGNTPLKLAASCDNIIIYELLMKQPDLQFDIYSIIGETITLDKAKRLFIAYKEKTQSIMQLLKH